MAEAARLKVPERVMPVPTTISPEGQAFLSPPPPPPMLHRALRRAGIEAELHVGEAKPSKRRLA